MFKHYSRISGTRNSCGTYAFTAQPGLPEKRTQGMAHGQGSRGKKHDAFSHWNTRLLEGMTVNRRRQALGRETPQYWECGKFSAPKEMGQNLEQYELEPAAG